MPLANWQCAHGDAPTVDLPVASTVNIAPLDDSVDTNTIKLTGTGTITSFGVGPLCTKKVILKTGITLNHTVGKLELLTGANRTITGPAIGYYSCQGGEYWVETQYIGTGAQSVEARLAAAETMITYLNGYCNYLDGQMTLRCDPPPLGTLVEFPQTDIPASFEKSESGTNKNESDNSPVASACCGKRATG